MSEDACDLSGVQVLVIDDSDDNLFLLTRFLKPTQATVITANQASEGIRLAQAQEFAVILMDMQMPEMDGLEATRRLIELGINTPVVALTAHASPEDRVRSLAAGCKNHLTKPIDRKLLISKIAYWAGLKSAT